MIYEDGQAISRMSDEDDHDHDHEDEGEPPQENIVTSSKSSRFLVVNLFSFYNIRNCIQ